MTRWWSTGPWWWAGAAPQEPINMNMAIWACFHPSPNMMRAATLFRLSAAASGLWPGLSLSRFLALCRLLFSLIVLGLAVLCVTDRQSGCPFEPALRPGRP